jgi:hypothetical protein
MIRLIDKNGKIVLITEDWKPKKVVALYRAICLQENGMCVEGEKEDCDSCSRYFASVDFLSACLKALGKI